MRQILCAALAFSAASAVAYAAEPQTQAPQRHRAVSAESYAVKASYTEGHGYSDRARHIANCLATYPTYDHRIDRIRVRPGVTRRCEL